MSATISHRYTFQHPQSDGAPVTLEIIESQMKLALKKDSNDPKVRAARQAISLRFNMQAKPRVMPPVRAEWLLANMTDDGKISRPGPGRPKGSKTR